MFLTLNHRRLDVYRTAQTLVTECYKIAAKLPLSEKYILSFQIRKAALSVPLNIAEGCSRKSPVERKRFFEIARSSVIEIDAALDIALSLGYLHNIDLNTIADLTVRSFRLLTGMLNAT
jgi:four helix bundle protein